MSLTSATKQTLPIAVPPASDRGILMTHSNDALAVDSAPTTFDVGRLFWCPYDSDINRHVEQARNHTLTWLSNAGVIATDRQRAYVDAMRLDLYAARCAPSLRPAELELFCDWVVFATLLDDHLDADDPQLIRPAVRQMVTMFEEDDPDRVCEDADVFVRALAFLWQQCQHIPQPWRRQLAELWAQWLESYLTEASWRKHHLRPSLARYREVVRVTSAAMPFTRLSEHLGGLYVPDLLLNSSALTEMRSLIPDHTMAVNDIVSARREAAGGDHINSVFVFEYEYGCTRSEAIAMVADRANAGLRHFVRLRSILPEICEDLGATAGRDEVERMADSLEHWLGGNLAWHLHDTRRYETGIEQLGEPLQTTGAGITSQRGAGHG